MEQYISKSALVAEIEKKLQDLIACKENTFFTEQRVVLWSKIDICKEILSILDTLKVKNVNLDEEIYKWQQKHFEGIGYVLDGSGGWIGRTSLLDIAEHFYELGLKAQKGE